MQGELSVEAPFRHGSGLIEVSSKLLANGTEAFNPAWSSTFLTYRPTTTVLCRRHVDADDTSLDLGSFMLRDMHGITWKTLVTTMVQGGTQ